MLPKPVHDPPRLLVDAMAGDANHLDPGERHVLLAQSVALERGARAVEFVGVKLDRKALARPVCVDLVALDEAVGGWHRQPRLPDQLEEPPLETRAREPRLGPVKPGRSPEGPQAAVGGGTLDHAPHRPQIQEPKFLGTLEQAGEAVGRNGRRHVEQRSGHGGDRYALACRFVSVCKRSVWIRMELFRCRRLCAVTWIWPGRRKSPQSQAADPWLSNALG
jgi:hypothetical protein